MNLKMATGAVQDRDALAEFVLKLAQDLKEHPERWENADLESYLQAMAAWIKDMPGYYLNRGMAPPLTPSWANFAEILAAASVYE